MQIRIIYYKGKSDATFIRTLSYAEGFVQNGISVRLSFLLPPEQGWTMENNIGITQENLFEGCPLILKKFRPTVYFYSLCKLLRSIGKGDVLYFTLPFLNTIVAAFAKLRGAKFFMEFTELPYYKINPGLLRYITSTSQLLAAKLADFVCVISKGLADFYHHAGVSRIHVINMFVDIERFKDAQVDSNDFQQNLITYCGSVCNSKDGVDILIKSFVIVHEKHPEARLRIIGTTSEMAMKSLQNLVKFSGVEEYVEFTGRVPFQNIPQLLKNSGILALARPSSAQAQYGFPTKLGEYLCTARPVVITRTGEIDLFLKDGESCLFAKADDVNDFAEKLNWCFENYEDAVKIGQNGSKVACTSFSALIETKKVLEEIRKIVN